MKIKLIDYGLPYDHLPYRAHYNDAGADVYLPNDLKIAPGNVVTIALGFGLEIPDGYAGFIYPRSSLSSKGVVCELPPIDSGYRGEIHAILSNVGQKTLFISAGERIGQLVITPVILADFVSSLGKSRNTNAFGSTGW